MCDTHKLVALSQMPQEQIMKIRLPVNKDNGDDEIKRSMVQTMTVKMVTFGML